MTLPRTLEDLAQSLASAWRESRPVGAQPWQYTLNDADAAYRVQDRIAEILGWFDAEGPRHWKSGGPSREAVLTHAPLPPAGVRQGAADLSGMHFNLPGIESEIALRLGERVTPARAAALTPDDAHGLIDAMAVSIEVVDSRWSEAGQAPAGLRLADAQSHGALVLGDWTPYARRDWVAQRCETRIGARPVDVRTGTHTLADPAWLLPAWLRHATRHGLAVPAGAVVTTGSWVGLLEAARGEPVVVEFAGVGRAELRL